jgi:hypothetical protein
MPEARFFSLQAIHLSPDADAGTRNLAQRCQGASKRSTDSGPLLPVEAAMVQAKGAQAALLPQVYLQALLVHVFSWERQYGSA